MSPELFKLPPWSLLLAVGCGLLYLLVTDTKDTNGPTRRWVRAVLGILGVALTLVGACQIVAHGPNAASTAAQETNVAPSQTQHAGAADPGPTPASMPRATKSPSSADRNAPPAGTTIHSHIGTVHGSVQNAADDATQINY